jgi:hypothetical protein
MVELEWVVGLQAQVGTGRQVEFVGLQVDKALKALVVLQMAPVLA